MRKSAIIAALVLMAACSQATRQPHGKALLDSAGPSRHAVQDQRLRELMAEMYALHVSEKEMTDHQRDALRREYNLKMAENAEAMGKTVEAILDTLPALQLSQEDQATFKDLAGRLHNENNGLMELARANHSDALAGQLDKIALICKGCHQLFRMKASSG